MRIRDPVLLTPGSGMGKNGIPGTRDEHFFSRGLENIFLGEKYFPLMRIGIRDFFDPGSGMENFVSGIRNKHPGSATLLIRRPEKYMIFDDIRLSCLVLQRSAGALTLGHRPSVRVLQHSYLYACIRPQTSFHVLNSYLFYFACGLLTCYLESSIQSAKKAVHVIILGLQNWVVGVLGVTVHVFQTGW
jgi:hypothetical protein